MFKYLSASVLLALATGEPPSYAGTGGLSLGSYSGGGGHGFDIAGGGGGHGYVGGNGNGGNKFAGALIADHSGLSLGDHSSYNLGGGGGIPSYESGGSGLSVSNDGGSHNGGQGSDYHHGVSIVGTGQSKGTTLDLTKSHGAGHQGVFGGSFISSAKYENAGGHGGGGHGGGGHGDSSGHYELHQPVQDFAAHYTDVLRASDDNSHGSLSSYGHLNSGSSDYGHHPALYK